MTGYSNVTTQKTIYQDPIKGVVNGVVIDFTMDAYNERGQVRIPEMNATLAQAAIEAYVTERDKLAGVV